MIDTTGILNALLITVVVCFVIFVTARMLMLEFLNHRNVSAIANFARGKKGDGEGGFLEGLIAPIVRGLAENYFANMKDNKGGPVVPHEVKLQFGKPPDQKPQ